MDAIGDPLKPQVGPSILKNELSVLERFARGIDQYSVVGILLGFTISGAWRDHLQPSNFVSCAGIMSRGFDRRQILGAISRIAKVLTGSAEDQDKSAMLVKPMGCLKGLGHHGAVQLMLLHIWSSSRRKHGSG